MGAQWIHGQGHSVYKFAKANGLLNLTAGASAEETGDYFFDNGQTVRLYTVLDK